MIETLEENQVQLQNMMTSKFIGYFLTEISGWQKTLCVVDHVTTIWFDVQRTWSHLESIFIGSEDIRVQLPEDSERFDVTNAEFKRLMVDRNGILRERASIARGRFPSDCGRICGILKNSAAKVNSLRVFHKMGYYFHKLALLIPLFLDL